MRPLACALLSLWLAASLSACFAIPTAIPIRSETPKLPTITTVPSPTPVWFPPTPTYTPFPTPAVTPTEELRPGIGEILLRDNFSKSGPWQHIITANGSISVEGGTITVAINAPKAYLTSLRTQPNLVNFYLEITASPSLCKGADEYGLLLRATSSLNYYRFSLTCDGRSRLDRVAAGVASSPQPWINSGGVPPGAPSSSRLAVWAVGNEMRFFVNDIYQFTIHDPLLPSGNVGIFARSAGDNALTVSFSNLEIHKVNPVK